MSKVSKIVFLTDCLVDPNAGGAERKIYEIASHLNKDRFQVFICSLDCEGTAPQGLVESLGCDLQVFKVKRIYGWSGLKEGIRFFQFLKKNKIDILQTYHFSSDIWGTFWGHLAGVKNIISSRRDMGFWRKRYHHWAYRLVRPWVKKVLVNSKAIIPVVMKTDGFKREKIEVIYNGVTLNVPKSAEKIRALKDQLHLTETDVIMMHVANFKPVKGHQYLIQAMAQLVKKYPQLKLILIGEDEFNGKLQTMAVDLKIKDNVFFLGKRDDVRQLLPMADICILPSLSEGMSNAILEYMAAGKPVVATSVGGNPENIEDGIAGILVKPKDVDSLVEAIGRLVRNPDLRLRMGQAALELAYQKFDINVMFAQYENLYDQLIEHS